jgi:hypothetical protein
MLHYSPVRDPANVLIRFLDEKLLNALRATHVEEDKEAIQTSMNE